MARTRAQAVAQEGLVSPASKGQGTRPQAIQSRKGATTISETSSQQNPPALQSRGRKRKQPIEIAVEPGADRERRGPKRQQTSPTRPAGNTIDELLSRKRGIDGPAESNLPRAKRVRRAKALEHASQERAISDHADFHSSRENLAASVEGEGEKLSHAIQDTLDQAPDGSLKKRRRTSLGQSIQEAGDDTEDWRNIIDFWRREGSWPNKYFEPDDSTRKDFERQSEDSWLKEMERYDPTVKLLFAKKKTTSVSRKRSGSDSSTTASQDTTPSDQRLREEKNAPYRNPRYPLLLQTKGSYMGISELGVTDTSKQLIRDLLSGEQSVPKETLFDDDIFVEACCNLETKNEARIIQDISRLIVPSAESLALCDKKYKHLIESVNEGWNNSIPLTNPRPQPDYSVGFRRDAFTEDQLAKLSPFIGDFIVGDQSFFMATYYMYFPFLTCEVKCGAAALDIADRQNAHSMTLAVRGIVELFRAVKREHEVNRKILAFSVSHDHRSVRIYGHYPVISGKDVKYYRHPIHDFSFTALDGRDKWTAYRFTKNVYDTWMPAHFKNICSAIDQLPSDLDFDVPPLSEATGLSQDLGNLMQSDGSCASMPDERGSQSSNAEQQAVTPGTSFSEPKRRKG
ncbi:hypothetical protein N657DRAFT_604532 [Parathielavia appendiculata]|uniref:DUF7924 domain-containing protein n=1 Tax=Parathielavia appendiculata TaxID=2587402 RepID=A0AAN6TRK9_9PEZI|nr:hypothetical protein N657DRAFT_604532 [Parathielavia appendiculata]